jgi:hypothetical protein
LAVPTAASPIEEWLIEYEPPIGGCCRPMIRPKLLTGIAFDSTQGRKVLIFQHAKLNSTGFWARCHSPSWDRQV